MFFEIGDISLYYTKASIHAFSLDSVIIICSLQELKFLLNEYVYLCERDICGLAKEVQISDHQLCMHTTEE